VCNGEQGKVPFKISDEKPKNRIEQYPPFCKVVFACYINARKGCWSTIMKCTSEKNVRPENKCHKEKKILQNIIIPQITSFKIIYVYEK
jgi:hypothetical protein